MAKKIVIKNCAQCFYNRLVYCYIAPNKPLSKDDTIPDWCPLEENHKVKI